MDQVTEPWQAVLGAVVGLWFAIALLEILVPSLAIRWRRRLIDKQRGRFGSRHVADFFDQLTGERGYPDAWTIPSVQRRVRVLGLANLLLACLAAFVLAASR
jgi:hypothetical protein